MMREFLSASALVLLFLGPVLPATVEVDADRHILNLTPFLEYREDPGRNLILSDIELNHDGWNSSGLERLNFGYTGSAWWFRAVLKNITAAELSCLLELDYPQLNFIDLHVVDEKKNRTQKKAGDWYPFRMRDLFEKNFYFKLSLPPGANTVFFRVSSDSPVKFAANLYSLEGYARKKNLSDSLYGLYYGFFLAVIIVSLSFFLGMRNRALFFLFLFVTCLSLLNFNLNGFAFQYLWPGSVLWNNVAPFCLMSGVMIFFSLFVLAYLGEFRIISPYCMITLPLVVVAGAALALFFIVAEKSRLHVGIFSVWVVAALIVLFAQVLVKSLQGHLLSRYVLAALLFFCCGVGLYALHDLGFIPYTLQVEWSLQLSYLAMVLTILAGVITEVKKGRDELAASEKRLSGILTNTGEGFIETDAALVVRDVNPALCRMVDMRREDVLGRSIIDFIPQEDRPMLARQRQLRESGVMTPYDLSLKGAGGEILSVIVNSSIIAGADGKAQSIMALITNITERKKQEDLIRKQRDELQAAYEELEATNEELNATNTEYEAMNEELMRAQQDLEVSLHEKELLLMEIHHRVKNNLQVISSLLHLQSGLIENDNDRALFIESENRIRSMALVHQKIYQSRDLSRIDFSHYLADVVDDLFQAYSVDRDRIAVSIESSGVVLGVTEAVPCALIVNEAVTNAITHAFPDGRKGVISIGLAVSDTGMCLLSIGDDGVGFPESRAAEKKESLGMELIEALARQLRGTLEISAAGGVLIRLSFPLNHPR
jgi:PAS domain S-box-containing protein